MKSQPPETRPHLSVCQRMLWKILSGKNRASSMHQRVPAALLPTDTPETICLPYFRFPGTYIEASCRHFWWPFLFYFILIFFYRVSQSRFPGACIRPNNIPDGNGWQGSGGEPVRRFPQRTSPTRSKRVCGSSEERGQLSYKELPRLDASRGPSSQVRSICRIHVDLHLHHANYTYSRAPHIFQACDSTYRGYEPFNPMADGIGQFERGLPPRAYHVSGEPTFAPPDSL